jgi:uncharacterized metal-binding protein YceD (DUF177 family)
MATDLDVAGAWRETIPVADATRGTVHRKLQADELARARITKLLGLDGLKSLEASIAVSPWLDGVQVEGDWKATVTQTCGVSLDLFDTDLAGHISVRLLPQGSAALGQTEEQDMDLDPDADDPPDVLIDADIPIAAYVVEELSLAIDPFPRKPGVEFTAPDLGPEPSPFAVLAKLKGNDPDA